MRKSRVIFSAASKLATLPGIRRALPSGRKRRPKPRRRAAPIHDKDHAVLRPSFPQPPTLPQNEDAHNTQNPGRPTNKRAVAVARQRALRGARRRAQGRRPFIFGEPGRGEAREPSRARSHILETDDRRVVGNCATTERFIKERRLLVEQRRRRRRGAEGRRAAPRTV